MPMSMTGSEVECHDQHTSPTNEKRSRLISTTLYSAGPTVDNAPPDVVVCTAKIYVIRGLDGRERSN